MRLGPEQCTRRARSPRRILASRGMHVRARALIADRRNRVIFGEAGEARIITRYRARARARYSLSHRVSVLPRKTDRRVILLHPLIVSAGNETPEAGGRRTRRCYPPTRSRISSIFPDANPAAAAAVNTRGADKREHALFHESAEPISLIHSRGRLEVEKGIYARV